MDLPVLQTLRRTTLYQGFAPVHDLCVEGQGTTFGDVQT